MNGLPYEARRSVPCSYDRSLAAAAFLRSASVLNRATHFSEHTAQVIDEAVRDIVAAAFRRAWTLLEGHRESLERASALLLERETLAEPELQEFAKLIASIESQNTA